MSALKHWLWLSSLRGLGSQTRLALLRRFGSPEDIYYADEGELLLTEGIKREEAALLENKSLAAAEKILADCSRLGLRILTIQDAEYPGRLKNIYDPPILLYVKGRLPAFDEEAAVAVVGTRDCSPYGVACARKLGYGLASGGAVVVSGLAKGVDAEATHAALRAGGFAVGVVGNGLDIAYPHSSRALYEDIAAAGVLISEYPPGTEPARHHFPMRNRIISGLCVATLVVEAPEKSGALITAAAAVDQGRDVFAVPGPIDAPGSADPGRRGLGRRRLGHFAGIRGPLSWKAPRGWSKGGSSRGGLRRKGADASQGRRPHFEPVERRTQSHRRPDRPAAHPL